MRKLTENIQSFGPLFGYNFYLKAHSDFNSA